VDVKLEVEVVMVVMVEVVMVEVVMVMVVDAITHLLCYTSLTLHYTIL
jgi:hypothetical protein